MKTHYLDITRERCPMTFVKTKLKLEELDEGDILEILLTEGEPLQNLPRSLQECGYQVEVQPQSSNYLLLVRKSA